MSGLNTFPAILRLYKDCRRAGVWTRLVLESEADGKETVTFSTVTKSTSRPGEKAKYKKEGRRRIKPAKAKRDRERRDAWLERRRTAVGKPVAVVPAVAPVTEPAPTTPEETDRTLVFKTVCLTFISQTFSCPNSQYTSHALYINQ